MTNFFVFDSRSFALIRRQFFLLTLALAAHAQTSRGTVTGTILDPTGAVIGGARVILTGVETGVKVSTDSNEAGVYRFDAVDLGVYDLMAANRDLGSARWTCDGHGKSGTRALIRAVQFFFKQDSDFRTEQRPYLVEPDGTCWKYEQYPGELRPALQVEPENEAKHQELFPILK